WLVLTSAGVTKTTSELSVELKGELEGSTKEALLSKILGIKIEKTCTGVTLVGMKLEGEGNIAPGGKLKFTGCKLFLNGEESTECTPHTSGAPIGTIE